MDFVENILKELKRNNYTDSEICKLLNKNSSYLTDWKNGKSKPKVEDVIVISELLHTSIDSLLGQKNVKQNEEKRIADGNTSLKTSDYFIAYMDVLGAKKLMEKDDAAFLQTLKSIYDNALLNAQIFNKHTDVNFNIETKIFSDNIIFAIKKTNNAKDDLLNLQFFVCCVALFQKNCLIYHSILLRGGISVGNLCINDNFVFGSALVDAYLLESNIAIYPRIVIDEYLLTEYKQIKNSNLSHTDFDDCCIVNYLNDLNVDENEKLSDYLYNCELDNIININTRQLNLKIKQKKMWIKHYFSALYNSSDNTYDKLIDQSTTRIVANSKETSIDAISGKDPKKSLE